jgi:hypothetical protein
VLGIFFSVLVVDAVVFLPMGCTLSTAASVTPRALIPHIGLRASLYAASPCAQEVTRSVVNCMAVRPTAEACGADTMYLRRPWHFHLLVFFLVHLDCIDVVALRSAAAIRWPPGLAERSRAGRKRLAAQPLIGKDNWYLAPARASSQGWRMRVGRMRTRRRKERRQEKAAR